MGTVEAHHASEARRAEVLTDGTASQADLARRFNVRRFQGLRHERLLLAFQPLIAFTVVSATLLYPLEATIAVAGLVRVILIKASVHSCLAGGQLLHRLTDQSADERQY
ncbi:hypothetical protein QEV83_06990 [Methylocapsa sp. D3K7]|uniref:hypothetical protein n=1 Tax=Methylocapsa sp. D3K7 TaxID=3041435 RepID=UPI00244EDDD3|nr:hypothetical protein [Methylocapsa sp. D3K7]WGJ15984.1 hypothetical protein QEV83_06990 [Methylocapsa sp. D3K7]